MKLQHIDDIPKYANYFAEVFSNLPPDVITLRLTNNIPTMQVPGFGYCELHPWELQWLTENRNVLWEKL